VDYIGSRWRANSDSNGDLSAGYHSAGQKHRGNQCCCHEVLHVVLTSFMMLIKPSATRGFVAVQNKTFLSKSNEFRLSSGVISSNTLRDRPPKIGPLGMLSRNIFDPPRKTGPGGLKFSAVFCGLNCSLNQMSCYLFSSPSWLLFKAGCGFCQGRAVVWRAFRESLTGSAACLKPVVKRARKNSLLCPLPQPGELFRCQISQSAMRS
jgi:hypothetical protein